MKSEETTSKMEEIATLSGGMALNFYTAKSYVSLSASCTFALYTQSERGAGGGQDMDNPVQKGWAIS